MQSAQLIAQIDRRHTPPMSIRLLMNKIQIVYPNSKCMVDIVCWSMDERIDWMYVSIGLYLNALIYINIYILFICSPTLCSMYGHHVRMIKVFKKHCYKLHFAWNLWFSLWFDRLFFSYSYLWAPDYSHMNWKWVTHIPCNRIIDKKNILR